MDDNMSNEAHIAAKSGLRFFGKMGASISHEIKNILAIINENTGLINDLILLKDQGIAVDWNRIKDLLNRVSNQVRRSDEIIKNMNALFHSIDDPVKRVNVEEQVRLMISLFGRFSSQKEVSVKYGLESDPVSIDTSPFLLETLLYLCMDYATDFPGEIRTVTLNVRDSETGAEIIFSGLQPEDEINRHQFPSEMEKAILTVLEGKIEVDRQNGIFTLRLPGKIGEIAGV